MQVLLFDPRRCQRLGDDSGRREFLKLFGATSAGAVISTLATEEASASESNDKNKDFGSNLGCLIDTTQCVGCRSCEEACNLVNELP